MVIANANDNQAPGIEDFFKSMPFVTRYWFSATMLLTLTGNFGVINPMQFIWAWPMIRDKFELWRVLTSFCYAGPFAFDTLICIYMLYNMSNRYETSGPFNTGAGGGTADYVFAMMFAVVTILLTYPLLLGMFALPPIFCRNLVYFVMYVWSKRHPTAQANIWGIPMPAIWLPFAYLALTVFMGNPYFDLLHGLAIGHLYYFLADVFPQVSGKDILVTPNFLVDKFGIGNYTEERANVNVPRERPGEAAAAARGGGAHQWGAGGQALGRQ